MSASASRRSARVVVRGLTTCFVLFALVCSIGIAEAEPLLIEVAKAEALLDKRTKEPVLSLTLNEASKKLFTEFTEKNIGRTIVLRFEGRVLLMPVIRDPIVSGVVHISGSLTANEAKKLSERLLAGSKIEVDLVQ